MAVKTLQEVYQEKGKEFIDILFTKKITVLEQLNGSSITLCRRPDKIFFTKGDMSSEITDVDLIINQYWSNPIEYLLSTPVESLPLDWKFRFEYFYSTKPVFVQYDRLPKNGLVLTAIIDSRGNTITDQQIINNFINLFQVEPTPIIFTGFLNTEQKTNIMHFLSTPTDNLGVKYGTTSFTGYLISVLNPKIASTALGNNVDSQIESLIFIIEDDNTNMFSIIDPVMQAIMKKNVLDPKKEPKHIYSLILVELLQFVASQDIDIIPLKSEKSDARYLELMCFLFNRFIREFGNDFIGIDFSTPDYMKNPIFSLNIDRIENIVTKELVSHQYEYEEIFKIFISSFRKKRKNINAILTYQIITEFNQIVDKIQLKINGIKPLNESQELPTWDEYKKSKSQTDFFEEITPIETIEEPVNEPSPTEVSIPGDTSTTVSLDPDVLDYLTLLQLTPKAQGSLEADLIFVNDLPSKNLEVLISRLQDQQKHVIICAITQDPLMSEIFKYWSKEGISILIFPHMNLTKIIKFLRPQYEPTRIWIAESKFEFINTQLDWLIKNIWMIEIILETDSSLNEPSVLLKCIAEKDYATFINTYSNTLAQWWLPLLQKVTS